MGEVCCPKCGSTNVIFQREQVANIGVGTNKVVIEQPKKSRGCLYWLGGGWIFRFLWWCAVGWWWDLLFGGKKKGGLNLKAGKSINRTVGVCQDCGHTWKA